MYRVKYYNGHTCNCWYETYSTFTAAWVEMSTAKQRNDPKRLALDIEPNGTFWCKSTSK